MTRINTNVSSLNAQKTLARSNSQLQTALTRLSTGLRINSGKDDPAGLIASEVLRSDITSTQKAVSNSQRAIQMIATADSALGQVSSLLNDIRGLTTEAANTGAMSADQIAANQLQVDSALEALNRIAQTTQFQGRRLLDGSLDFVNNAASVNGVSDVQIDQANLGATGQIGVSVEVANAATQAKVTTTGFSKAAAATTTLTFGSSFVLTGDDSGKKLEIRALDSKDYTNVDVVLDNSGDVAGGATATYDGSTLKISIDKTGGATQAQIEDAINTGAQTKDFFSATADGAFTKDDNLAATKMKADSIDLTAINKGSDYNNVAVSIVNGSTEGAVYDAVQHTLTLTLKSQAYSLDDIETVLTNANIDDIFTITKNHDALAADTDMAGIDKNVTANTGSSGGGALLADLVLEVAGVTGAEVFNFKAGTTSAQVASAINLVSDSLGVTAAASTDSSDNSILTLNSSDYGSAAFVSTDVISEGTGGAFEQNLSASRAAGTDIDARINGVKAGAKGNTMTINTAALDMSLTVDDGFQANFNFSITGGGALFQMGPDVVRSQQARLGIGSVNSGRLGGPTGRLYELGSGNTADLATDPTKGAKIVDEVINKVASLRGRLGAFQATTLDSNINSLSDTLENLTSAESSIRDADFAAESANLTRAQVLVQSGTSVLQIANQSPQNVLALLRG